MPTGFEKHMTAKDSTTQEGKFGHFSVPLRSGKKKLRARQI